MIALAEKGLDYELKNGMCRANRPKDAALSELYYSIHVDPTAKVLVPVLQHQTDQGMVNIIESIPCAEYVEDAFPDVGNSLRPKSAKQRNQIRMFLEVANKFMPFGVVFSKYENLDKAFKDFAAAAKQMNAALERWGEAGGGDFLLGNQFSMAEVLPAPLLMRLSMWDWWRGVNAIELIEKLGHARLAKWMKAVMARESVKKTFHNMEKHDMEEYFQFLGASPGKVSYTIKDGTVTVTHVDGEPYCSKPGHDTSHDVTPGLLCAIAAAFFAVAGLSYLRR